MMRHPRIDLGIEGADSLGLYKAGTLPVLPAEGVVHRGKAYCL